MRVRVYRDLHGRWVVWCSCRRHALLGAEFFIWSNAIDYAQYLGRQHT